MDERTVSWGGYMKYRVGDKVKVRKWDDMVAEFGLDVYGNIKTPEFLFVEYMKDCCDKTATIVRDDLDENGDRYYTIKIDSMDGQEQFFYFTDEMIEDINDENSPMLLGFDIYNFIKEFSKKNMDCGDSMTEDEREAYEFGKMQILSLLNQVLNKFFKEDSLVTPTYIVHVPGLATVTDFASIDEIQEQFGDKNDVK